MFVHFAPERHDVSPLLWGFVLLETWVYVFNKTAISAGHCMLGHLMYLGVEDPSLPKGGGEEQLIVGTGFFVV